MKSVLAKHDFILKEAIESNHGQIIKTTGDGIHAVFSTAADAVNAAIDAQRKFQTSETPTNGETSEVSLRVRIGLHTGEAELREDDYFGGTLNRAARIMSIGHGGQILVSDITWKVAREHLPKEISTLDLGYHRLKGLDRPERIYQLNVPDLQQEFPALRSLNQATNNLPTQLTSFIGREQELSEAKSRLDGARLLTLIGPGGTGKTRLSIQLGSQLLTDFKDGVWLVEALSSYRETIPEWQKMGHRSAVAHQMESMAFIFKALEQTDRAARLLGAAEALRQKIEIDMTPPEREEYEKEVADLKVNMDEKELTSLWMEGGPGRSSWHWMHEKGHLCVQ